MPSIYRKTAKGQSEIETRAHKLPPRLRTALIMVDGKRSEADLRPMLLQAPEETLAALLAQGFIEVVGGGRPDTAAAPAASAPVAAPVPSSLPQPTMAPRPPATPTPTPTATPAATPMPVMQPMPVPLPVRRREAVRMLTDQVGPMAEAIAVRMEKARSEDELRSAVMLGAQVIANTRGRQAAERFVAHFADL